MRGDFIIENFILLYLFFNVVLKQIFAVYLISDFFCLSY